MGVNTSRAVSDACSRMEWRLLSWVRGQKCLKGGVLVSENRLSRAILPLCLSRLPLQFRVVAICQSGIRLERTLLFFIQRRAMCSLAFWKYDMIPPFSSFPVISLLYPKRAILVVLTDVAGWAGSKVVQGHVVLRVMNDPAYPYRSVEMGPS